MSEHGGVHIHAAHEEMVHHKAEHEGGLAAKVAVVTALLATIGSFFSYESGLLATDALLHKNDAIASQTKASDQWAYYQAKSTREFLASNMASLATDEAVRTRLLAEAARYNKEKNEIAEEAKKLEAEAHKNNEEAEAKIPSHERIGFGVTLMQAAVAIASVTVLTGKKWLFYICLAFALIGIYFAGLGYFGHLHS